MVRTCVQRTPFADYILASQLSATACTSPDSLLLIPRSFDILLAAESADALNRRTWSYEQVTPNLCN